jgi:hypothetical protein
LLLFNYGHYEFWEAYNPPNSTFGGQKVTFDGISKLILINEGETNINVRSDIYSNWKEWILYDDNAKYIQALTVLGGDPITDTTFVGLTYFLENGWRIKPWTGNYILTIDGNIYTREPGENPAIPVSGVSVNFTRSNLVDFATPVLSGNVDVGNVSISNTDIAQIANTVWNYDLDGKPTIAKDKLSKIATKSQDIALN